MFELKPNPRRRSAVPGASRGGLVLFAISLRLCVEWRSLIPLADSCDGRVFTAVEDIENIWMM